MNMRQWVDDVIASPVKRAMPVLSFPCIQLLGIDVKQLISSAEMQAKGMKMVADRVPTAAAVSMMDLSVEAEAFGSTIRVTAHEVPTVVGAIIEDEDEADELEVPEVGTGRTGLYVEAIGEVKKLITDRPVLAGTIGPYSLAGRLMGVQDIMVLCYEEPDMVKKVLDKATEFIINYMKAFKKVGADGVVMAEPLTGMLSPAMAEEFSEPWCKRIVDEVQDDEFLFVYHNCGNNVPKMIDSVVRVGAWGYHFGDAIDMSEVMPHIPADRFAAGNVSPSLRFLSGTPESVREATLELMNKCGGFSNFVISSGCDIPPMSPWENIDAFFAAVNEFYASKN
jgi:uroporphyrinogen decarboxylase